MAGVCDVGQDLCMALALWNGRDPILKERMFGLTGPQGNHGEDVKEYWWYLDALPSHSLAAVALPLPAGASSPTRTWWPRTAGATRASPSTSCWTPACSTTTGTGWSRWSTPRPTRTTCSWRSASPTPGPEAATLHVLPHLWFRNTWAWDAGAERPTLRAAGADRVASTTRRFGELAWEVDAGRTARRPSCCSATTRPTCAALRVGGVARRTPRTAINDHVVGGAATVNPDRRRDEVRGVVPADRRAGRDPGGAGPPAPAVDDAGVRRAVRRGARAASAEADEFYAEVIPAGSTTTRAWSPARPSPG